MKSTVHYLQQQQSCEWKGIDCSSCPNIQQRNAETHNNHLFLSSLERKSHICMPGPSLITLPECSGCMSFLADHLGIYVRRWEWAGITVPTSTYMYVPWFSKLSNIVLPLSQISVTELDVHTWWFIPFPQELRDNSMECDCNGLLRTSLQPFQIPSWSAWIG